MTPKISIIIATYNSEKYIEGAIESILAQNYSNFELIIIDGLSTDNTINILKKYKENISYWISENDLGIYDAWNKGIQKSFGEWIMFLGSDDILANNALNYYSNFINILTYKPDYISSRALLVNNILEPIRIKGWKWEWPRFLYEMTVSHPGSLHSKNLFQEFGMFNVNYKIVGDYEFLLRAKNHLKSEFMDHITVLMREGGVSESLIAIQEKYFACINTGKCNKIIAFFIMIFVSLKFLTKYIFKLCGIYIYLRK